MTPLNTSLYSSFTYTAPPSSGGFGGGLTPAASIFSATESAHVTSTIYAPTGVFSLNLQFNSENLTAEQATYIYNLGVECQALGTKFADKFQTLSGLEAIHRATAQATAHEIINAGHTTWSEVYVHLPRDKDCKPKHKETLQQLLAEADKAWKDTDDVVYSHQL